MKAKSVLYAAVGAPAVAAKKITDRANNLGSKLSAQASGYGESFGKAVDSWAVEGERIVGRISDGKVVDELTSKVDLDQAKEQVGKLRDQLEDMLSTWRSSFRPEKAETEADASASDAAEKAADNKPKQSGSPAKTATKASAAKTAESTAAKTSQTKPEATAKVDKAS